MIRILFFLIAAISLLGCEKRAPEPQPVTANDVTQQMSEAKNAAIDYAARRKQDYVDTARREMDQLKLKLDQVRTRAAEAGTTAKATLNRQTELLDEKWKNAERKLSELKSAGNDRWQHFKGGVEESIGDLKRLFSRAETER
jgi:hypothetical protein